MDLLAGLPLLDLAREAIALVVAIILLVILDRRLFALVQSQQRSETTITHAMAHQTARMTEIRNAVVRIAQQIGRLDGE